MESWTVLAIVALFLNGCSALTVVLRPSDTARTLGSNVTLACVVTNKAASESVQWKHQPRDSDAINALTFNENVLSNPAKYAIKWTYNLTVFNLTPSDAGLYRCTAGGVDYDAFLTVVDLPTNITIEMVGEPVNGETHNLTCQVSKSLPPPEVKWLVNGVDMTSRAAVSNTTVSPSGYGEVTSTLSLALDESLNGGGAECVLSYRGWDHAVRATYTLRTIYPGGYANSGTGIFNPGTFLFPNSDRNLTSGLPSGGLVSNQGAAPRGTFLIRFMKQSASENINWELQQYQP